MLSGMLVLPAILRRVFLTEQKMEMKLMSDVQTSDPIADAIEAGRTAAASMVGNQPANALTTAAAPTAVATSVMPGPKLSMDNMMAQGLSVDAFLKPNEFAMITIGDDGKQHDSLDVEIDTAAITLCFAIKYGNPAVYVKSYDGTTANTGGTFTDAIAKANAATGPSNPVAPYNCADIPMTLLTSVPKQDAKAEPFAVGMKLGYSTPTTGWNNFDSFVNAIKAKGLMGQKVRAKLTSQPRTNKKANKWGVIAFELVA
jgi:hypothetical protein